MDSIIKRQKKKKNTVVDEATKLWWKKCYIHHKWFINNNAGVLLFHIIFPPKGLLLSMYWPKKEDLNLNAKKLLQRDVYQGAFFFLVWHLKLFFTNKGNWDFEANFGTKKTPLMNKIKCAALPFAAYLDPIICCPHIFFA